MGAGIEQQSAQATTAEQKALAELALKHYENAAQLFNAAGDADRQQISTEDTQEQSLEAQVKALQAAQQSFLNKQRTTMQQLLDHSQQAAGAYQLNLQFHQATQTLASAETAMEAECKKHPDDKGFHELWLQALWAVANGAAARGRGVARERKPDPARSVRRAILHRWRAKKLRWEIARMRRWRKTASGMRSRPKEREPLETRLLRCSIRRCRRIAVRSRSSPKPNCPRTGL